MFRRVGVGGDDLSLDTKEIILVAKDLFGSPELTENPRPVPTKGSIIGGRRSASAGKSAHRNVGDEMEGGDEEIRG